MEIIGNDALLHDLHHKEILGKNGRRRRRACFGTPGMKAGAVDANRRHAITDAGILADHFDVNFGVSASSWNAAAQCAGQSHLVADVYAQLSDAPFFFPTWTGDWINIERVSALMRGKVDPTMHLDQEAIRNSTCDLIIGTSDWKGDLVLHDAKTADDIVDLCHASSALPAMTCGKTIEGTTNFDGGCAHPCPIRQVLKETCSEGDEVDVLLIASRPRPDNYHWFEQVMYPLLVHTWLWWYPVGLRNSTAMIDLKMSSVVRLFEKQRPNSRFRMCAIFPTNEECISPIEWSAERIRTAGRAAYGNLARFLEKKPAREI